MHGKAKHDLSVLCCWHCVVNDLATSGPKYNVHMKFHEDLICRFNTIVSALPQDYRKMTYPMQLRSKVGVDTCAKIRKRAPVIPRPVASQH